MVPRWFLFVAMARGVRPALAPDVSEPILRIEPSIHTDAVTDAAADSAGVLLVAIS